MTTWGPFRALMWEFGRVAWRRVAMTTLSGAVLAVLYRALLAPAGGSAEGVAFTSVLFPLLVINVLTVLTCHGQDNRLRFESRLFRLPVPTHRIVLARMLPSLLAVSLMFGAVWTIVVGVHDAPWPLVGPLLLMVAVMACAQALAWSLGRWPLLVGPTAVAGTGCLFVWLRPRLGPDRLWRTLDAGDAMTLLGVTVVAVGVAIVGVARDRAAPGPTARLRVVERLSAVARGTTTDWHSPVRAQLWLEWREKGRYLPALAVAGLVVNVALIAVARGDAAAVVRTALSYLGFVLWVGPPVAGFLHGRFDPSSRHAGIDRLRATRPWADRHLAWTLLGAAGRSLIVSWLAVAAGVVAVLGMVHARGARAPVEGLIHAAGQAIAGRGAVDTVLVVMGLLGAGWVAMGTVAAITLTGRNRVVAMLAAGPYGLILTLVAFGHLLDKSLWSPIVPTLTVALTVLLPVVALALMVVAWRRGQVGGRVVVRLMLLWLAVAVIATLRMPTLHVAASGLFGGLFDRGALGWDGALPLLIPAAASWLAVPVVAAPMALAWNRHR